MPILTPLLMPLTKSFTPMVKLLLKKVMQEMIFISLKPDNLHAQRLLEEKTSSLRTSRLVMFLESLLFCITLQELLLLEPSAMDNSGYLIEILSLISSKLLPKRREKSMKNSCKQFQFFKIWTIMKDQKWLTLLRIKNSQVVIP